MVSPLQIPFDSLSLMAVCRELQAAIGSYVHKISQTDEWTVVIRLRRPGFETSVLLSCNPRFYRMHLTAIRPQSEADGFFGAALRRRVESGRLAAVSQHGFDRVAWLEIQKSDGLWRVVAELAGSRSNALLVDPAGKVFLAMRKVGSARQGAKYEPPNPPAPDLGTAVAERRGLSPFLLREVELMGPEMIMERVLAGARPVLVPGTGAYPFPPVQLEGKAMREMSSFSVALEQHYLALIPAAQREERRKSLRAQLERALDARRGALTRMEAVLMTAAEAREIQMQGELILANVASLPPGAERLETLDYEGRPLAIPLNSDLTALENAEQLFRKAKKAKAAAAGLSTRATSARAEALELRSLLDGLAEADDPTLDKIEARATERKWLRNRGAPPAPRKEKGPYEGRRIREMEAPGGFKVLWAENAAANDYLTTRVARPNDYWLHAQGTEGAHVIIQTQNRPERVQRETLLFAARIAARHSGQKHAKAVPVAYTLAKHVRKPRKSAAGAVVMTGEKTLFVDPEVRSDA